MHTGSTHFSNVGKERLQPLTNEPVRAEHGGWLHAESIRPCFYNLTTTSLKRRPYEGLTASSTESQKSVALEWKDWAIHPILPKSIQLPKDHSRELKSSVCVIFLKWHCIKPLPYCITLRWLCDFMAAAIHGNSTKKNIKMVAANSGLSRRSAL